MPDPGLVNYTRSSLASGKSNEEITDILRQNGQSDEQIKLIFDAVAGLAPVTIRPNSTETDNNFVASGFNPLKERYAGFRVRLIASLIDMIPFLFFKPLFPLYFLAIIYHLYNVLMVALYGASIGKMMVGIKVISDKGESLTVSKVLLREILGKMLSQVLYIGYIMVAFTRYKQGLHDKIAETYVVYRK